jgi:transcriptional regulator with XRE-family HTH domain
MSSQEEKDTSIYERVKRAFGKDSDAKISRRLNLDKSAVSKWKNGETKPSTDTLLLVAELTGVPLAQLKGEEEIGEEYIPPTENLQGEMTPERFTKELQALGVEDFHSIKSMKGLTPADMEEIIAVAKNTAKTTAQTMIEQRTKTKG